MTAAVDTLTEVLARELLERDITVNAVSPDIDKPCVPGKVADVIAYLLSDEGHAITGQVIHIDNREWLWTSGVRTRAPTPGSGPR